MPLKKLRIWKTVLAPVALLVAMSAERPTFALDKRVCATSYETAQLLRHRQKLRKAREQLAICSNNTCPSVVNVDCAAWLKEVDLAIPTLFFRVRDERARAVTEFRVMVDGEPVQRDPDAPLSLDPGPHLVRIEAEGLAPLEQNIVLKAGERSRVIESTLMTVRRESSSAEVPLDPLRGPPKGDGRPIDKSVAERQSSEKGPDKAQETRPPVDGSPDANRGDGTSSASASARSMGITIAGATGLVALGTGAYLGLAGTRETDELRATCAPDCSPGDVIAARNKLIAADLAFGASIGAFAIAGFLWITEPAQAPKSTSRTKFVGIDVRPLGGGGEIVTTFSTP